MNHLTIHFVTVIIINRLSALNFTGSWFQLKVAYDSSVIRSPGTPIRGHTPVRQAECNYSTQETPSSDNCKTDVTNAADTAMGTDDDDGF